MSYLWFELTLWWSCSWASPSPTPMVSEAVLGCGCCWDKPLKAAQISPNLQADRDPTFCAHPALNDDCGKQCWHYLSRLSFEAPGGTPGGGKSWDVSQHLRAQCHLWLVKLISKDFIQLLTSLQLAFSLSGPWFIILSLSAAAILLFWELCRREKQTDQCLMLHFLFRSLFSFLLPLHQY